MTCHACHGTGDAILAHHQWDAAWRQAGRDGTLGNVARAVGYRPPRKPIPSHRRHRARRGRGAA